MEHIIINYSTFNLTAYTLGNIIVIIYIIRHCETYNINMSYIYV